MQCLQAQWVKMPSTWAQESVLTLVACVTQCESCATRGGGDTQDLSTSHSRHSLFLPSFGRQTWDKGPSFTSCEFSGVNPRSLQTVP